MFILTTIVDTIRIPPHMLSSMPTLTALHCEIDMKYPNRVLYDVGLVIGRYGPVSKITNGSCVPGDGGCHHDCLFQIIVFRPFVDEVCVGKIVKSTPEGIHVSLGFFQDIFIPAYWMLRPSHYEESSGLWVWSPNYDEDEEEGESTKDIAKASETNGEKQGKKPANGIKDSGKNGNVTVKEEAKPSNSRTDNHNKKGITEEPENANDEAGDQQIDQEGEDETDRLEMEIGAEIRFKVKSIHFTQVTNTAKGVQATTITTAYSHVFPPSSSTSPPSAPTSSGGTATAAGGTGAAPDGGATKTATPDNIDSTSDRPQPLHVRKRSTSVDLSEVQQPPPSMQIIASICEDGLGLTTWWTSADDEEAEEQDGGEEVKQPSREQDEIEDIAETDQNDDDDEYGYI